MITKPIFLVPISLHSNLGYFKLKLFDLFNIIYSLKYQRSTKSGHTDLEITKLEFEIIAQLVPLP